MGKPVTGCDCYSLSTMRELIRGMRPSSTKTSVNSLKVLSVHVHIVLEGAHTGCRTRNHVA